MTFLLAEGNLPFTLALAAMLALGLLEGVGLVLGLGVSTLVDSLLPDFDVDVLGDMDPGDVELPSVFSRVLGWLTVGRVPALALLVAFLTVFGLSGLGVQAMSVHALGHALPAWIAMGPALVVAVPSVRLFGRTAGRLIPQEESQAVSASSFIGQVATITLGTALPGRPAEAKLRDRHGQTHYVRVEPDVEAETFPAGTAVLLVSLMSGVYRGIRNPSPALTDE